MALNKPQRVISKRIKPSLDVAINRMEHHQATLAKQPFTISDLLVMFVDPAYHTTLTEAYHLCEPTGRVEELYVKHPVPSEYGGGDVFMRFLWAGVTTPDAFYVPYKEGSTQSRPVVVRPDTPAELKAKFEQVADDLIGIHYRFAAVRVVLDQMNVQCRSLDQLAYYWPCIVPLLRDAKQSDLADALQTPNRMAAFNVKLTQGLRKLLAPTNQTVAAHQLIADVPIPDNKLPVEYNLQHHFRS